MSVADDLHPVIQSGRVALITGAASGIGRAAAIEFAKLGLKVAIADVDEAGLKKVGRTLANTIGGSNVLIVPTDVAKLGEVVRLRDTVYQAWGEVAVSMNNASIGILGTSWEGLDNWQKILNVNVVGVLNVQHTFLPSLLYQENPAMIINTGSKQGITNPPRPGWTFTGHTGASGGASKPPGAWTLEETVLYMIDKLREGAFYILCQDNETKREVDQLRITWGAADVTEGRPALSRWDPKYKTLFEEYMRDGLAQLG